MENYEYVECIDGNEGEFICAGLEYALRDFIESNAEYININEKLKKKLLEHAKTRKKESL